MSNIMITPFDLDAELASLQDEYTYRVNLLLDEGREDLAVEMSDRYTEEAAALVLQSQQLPAAS